MKSMTGNKKNKSILILAVISLGFCAFFAPYTSVLNNYWGIDTATYWVIGRGMLYGKIPYVDLFDHKGPMLFFIWALGSKSGAGSKWGIYILESVSLTMSLYAILKITEIVKLCVKQKIWCFLFYLLILCGTIVEGGLSEEWALPCSLYSFYIALAYFRGILKKREWFYGMALGMMLAYVAWMRLNNAAIVGSVTFVLFIYLLLNHRYKQILESILGFCIGVLMISFPIVLYFWENNAIDAMLYGSLTYNFIYSTGTILGKSMEEVIKIAAYEGIAFLFLIWLCVYEKKKGNFDKIKLWDMILMFFVGTVAAMASSLGYTWQHYFMIFLPCISVIAIYLVKSLNNKKGLIVLVCMLLPYSWQIARNMGKNVLFDIFGYYDDVFMQINQMQDIIPEEEQDKVWGIGWTTSKYFASNDIIPCYKIFDFPQILVNSPELYEDTEKMLQEEPPLWILRFSEEGDHIEGFSEYLESEYDLETVLQNESDDVINLGQNISAELWRRKE